MSEKLLSMLEKWYEDDQHDKIVEAIEQLPKSERNYELIGHYGRALNNLGRYQEALSELFTVKQQGQQDADWHWRVGYAYFYMQKWQEALDAFEKTLELQFDAIAEEYIVACQDIIKKSAEALEDIKLTPFRERDFSQFWEKSDYADKNYVEAPPTTEMIASIEEELGYKLPADYIWFMQKQNGGIPVNTCFPTAMPTSWAEDHVAITGIMGIGREKTYSLGGDLGSNFMLEEWGYPNIGVVIADCPSAGHDVIMLDYRACGADGEPAVVHVDQEADYYITFLAPNFATFITGLVNEEVFDTSEQDKLDDLDMVKHAPFSPLLQSLSENTGEGNQIEAAIRSICMQIVEDKGFFALHADELSMLMYDIQFWLYTNANSEVTREQYLADYKDIIALAHGFSTGGYAPDFVADWLDECIAKGDIVNQQGILSFTADKVARLQAQIVNEALKPFKWLEHDSGNTSFFLTAGIYKQELFETREDEGFQGNGYDWASLADVYLQEKLPELVGIVRFDPEADMFCAYSNQKEALLQFAVGFKQACENDELIQDLFSRAILD
ncbi:Imm51 family immunity protein [Bacillus ndiopicus]|uniref:Imm51 family immunity protein n=1 Tax=Bacillus ndiopicus TaxID=1347368 RepID=UPI0005A8BB8A|nr:Imm51 family immunity protein [Bacillus ndiopicus]